MIIRRIGLNIIMIQGFETREITDIPIRAFVKSADGTIHKKVKTVD